MTSDDQDKGFYSFAFLIESEMAPGAFISHSMQLEFGFVDWWYYV